MTLHCLIPAAGASSRMEGRDKLLEDVGGAPCLRVMAQRAIEAGLKVIVTLPSLDGARAQVLGGLDINLVPVPVPSWGMSASLAAGAAAVPEGSKGLMIVLADMPGLDAHDLRNMAVKFALSDAKILRARSARGKPGHPIIFVAELLKDFWHLTGDEGASRIVNSNVAQTAYFDFKDERPCLDLDTPRDWAAWRGSAL